MALVATFGDGLAADVPGFGILATMAKMTVLFLSGVYLRKKLEAGILEGTVAGGFIGFIGCAAGAAAYWSLRFASGSVWYNIPYFIGDMIVWTPVWILGGFILGAAGVAIAARQEARLKGLQKKMDEKK